mgnify:CR=1 FL=1
MENSFTVLFSCNSVRKVDPKNRVAVLAEWTCIAHGATLWMMRVKKGPYPVLKCYTKETYGALVNNIRTEGKGNGATPAEINDYIGYLVSISKEVEVNSQGKLHIPKEFKEHIKLQEEACLVGRDDYFEIWNKQDFEAHQKEIQAAIANSKLEKMFGTFT